MSIIIQAASTTLIPSSSRAVNAAATKASFATAKRIQLRSEHLSSALGSVYIASDMNMY